MLLWIKYSKLFGKYKTSCARPYLSYCNNFLPQKAPFQISQIITWPSQDLSFVTWEMFLNHEDRLLRHLELLNREGGGLPTLPIMQLMGILVFFPLCCQEAYFDRIKGVAWLLLMSTIYQYFSLELFYPVEVCIIVTV